MSPAAPSQEEVFQSFRDNLGNKTDPATLVALLCGVVGIVLVLVVFNKWRQRDLTPRVLNHHRKLLKEVSKRVDLRPAEVRHLRALAEQQEVSRPLVLLLCPSILGKIAREHPAKLDRKLVNQALRKMND
ncbi:MAG: hypothetical protein ACREJC_21635 [Tepidisphaeraceae bacterium]